MRPARRIPWLLLSLWLGASVAQAQPSAAADSLRQQFAAVRQSGAWTTLDRALHLQSTESAERLQGDVYAVIERAHAVVQPALARADQWCAILILHLNTKYCRPTSRSGREALIVGVGRRFDQPLSDAYFVNFDYARSASAGDYQQVVMQAPTGPMGTRDYRIALETTALSEGATLLHLTYAYSYGVAARMAMQTYLATLARDKVGFSVVGKRADGKPVLVGGVRGVVERNTMRYYLAIDAYLGTLALPAAEQMPASLNAWFAATERHALQLHEIDREEYLKMKRNELQRQATELPPVRQD